MVSLEDAIDGMSAREVEHLLELAQKRLQRCIICSADGALAVRSYRKTQTGNVSAAMLLCPACFERHRLPEGRAE